MIKTELLEWPDSSNLEELKKKFFALHKEVSRLHLQRNVKAENEVFGAWIEHQFELNPELKKEFLRIYNSHNNRLRI